MREELAIVSSVGFGMRDCNNPVLWFEVSALHGSSLQVFGVDKAVDIIKSAGVYDVKNLDGKACVISTDDSMMIFLRWHK